LEILSSVLKGLWNKPISVRSSATNEACILPEGEGSVHAGENTSFMLPNNHSSFSTRLHQLKQAIYHIYDDFFRKQPVGSREKMAIVINPIPGVTYDSLVGPIYYPLVSGVANSFFPYALKTQDPYEGFARVAFGHGYATVLDDFPVISVATIRNPIPLHLLENGQKYFYSIDMTQNEEIQGDELETMKKLHIRFANFHDTQLLGIKKGWISFESLVQENSFEFRSGLLEIMEKISSNISSHFQIEFVFNVDPNRSSGTFHIVQLTQLPELKFETIQIPSHEDKIYLSAGNFQGHGIKQGIQFAIVVSPFTYTRYMHDEIKKKISDTNRKLREQNRHYIIIVPGRLGSKNRDWGIQVDYSEVDGAAAIFEYGVDIAGRSEPLPVEESLTGGIYGSHFLYMIQGGYNEHQKRMQTRIYGTQGTHFLTNLVSNKIIYGYIAPMQDKIDPWFFTPTNGDDALYILKFPKSVSVYADSINQRCVIIPEC
jgi:hypothetical protein